ncbi:peptidase inhibitor family I36 protein [Streptomyces sp. V4-01]|uniref:Peptidase inhibitor family I36 protein n=1 Tax=Actinacidiphila polyblastidii TaxID=3110430 RepID=A0ABU7PDR0_9ACTN|nr:peptidase inhibitor family I36 protein [Streptomyces sp. V4-01]
MKKTSALAGAGLAAAALLFGFAVPASANSSAIVPASQPSALLQEVLRTHPDAKQVGANEISFDHGHANLTVSNSPAVLSDCKAGWYCFWQDTNFSGRRVSYNLCSGSSGNGNYYNLTTDNFNDQTTAFANNTNYSIRVFDDINAGGAQLWTEGAHSTSADVGFGNNDRASSFAC